MEATFGWYWAADVLAEMGAHVHLAHPLGNNWGNRRVKNDERDAADLVDLLRLGRLAEAWIAPPEVRELREMVRYRAKLVRLRSGLKAQVHAVMGKHGVLPARVDMFGPGGTAQLDALDLPGGLSCRLESLRELIAAYDRRGRRSWTAGSRRHSSTIKGYRAIQAINGVGPVMAAVFVAEIGDVTRFATPDRLCSWAGMTPRHRESDTKVHRGADHQARVAPVAVGGGRGGPEKPRGRRLQSHLPAHRGTAGPQHRQSRGRPQSSHLGLLRAARRRNPLPRQGHTTVTLGRSQQTCSPNGMTHKAGRHHVIEHCWLRRIAPCRTRRRALGEDMSKQPSTASLAPHNPWGPGDDQRNASTLTSRRERRKQGSPDGLPSTIIPAR